jgi:hypothetical protein
LLIGDAAAGAKGEVLAAEGPFSLVVIGSLEGSFVFVFALPFVVRAGAAFDFSDFFPEFFFMSSDESHHPSRDSIDGIHCSTQP